MASKVQFSLYFFCSLLLLQTLSNVPVEGKLEDVLNALYDVRHNAMSLTLQIACPQLISSSLRTRNLSTITIFSVPEKAFGEYGQPSLDVLRYHVALGKLEIKDLRSSLPRGFKIDTLFDGHPLIVTTTDPQNPSINNMTITMPDIYTDGQVIVHGVESFFDPYQKVLYPAVDTENLEKSGRSDMR
ncbi:hypothetical protein ACHQM5_026328 [Ranunculus cassubicifolius]